MCKYGEMFHANKDYILAINVLEIYGNKKYKFVVQFSNVICTKTKPCTPLLFTWKWITSTLFFIWLEANGNVFIP